MKFLCNTKDLEGTNAERRIQEVLAKGKDATILYSLKDNTCELNPNMKRYTNDQIEFIKEEMKDILYYFGYVNIAEDPANMTGFFEYAKKDSELLKTYNGFKELNT